MENAGQIADDYREMLRSDLAGQPLAEAMRVANAAAGLVVGKLGTATVSAEELAHALHARGDPAVAPLQSVETGMITDPAKFGRTIR